MKVWQKLTEFLESFDLIPLVILVSVYHYWQALKGHDPLWVSLPIALFVDLLHYRSVQQAVRSRRTGWGLLAVATTAMAFVLQWVFYAQAGVDGAMLAQWQQVVYAGLVPVGIAIMALHHETGLQDAASRVQEAFKELQERFKMLQEDAIGLQDELTQAQDAARKYQGLQEAFNDLQIDSGRMQKQLNTLQEDAVALQEDAVAFRALNAQAQGVARMLAGQWQGTQGELAQELGLHESQVSRLKGALNHVER